ncbi:MAG: hypothetical protein NTY41_16265 [Proteobacteria bacterium]|nr:hypothetical protein [Pseudomonadota bacterium]
MKPVIIFNLQANTIGAVQALNDESYRIVFRKPENFYIGEAAAADATQ